MECYSRKRTVEIYLCYKCGRDIILQDSAKPIFELLSPLVTKVVLGIHPDETSNYRFAPLLYSVYYFCGECSAGLFEKLADALTRASADWNREKLLEKPNMCCYQYNLLHWITFTEYIPLVLGRFFNIQMDHKQFAGLLENLPKELFGEFRKGELKFKEKIT